MQTTSWPPFVTLTSHPFSLCHYTVFPTCRNAPFIGRVGISVLASVVDVRCNDGIGMSWRLISFQWWELCGGSNDTNGYHPDRSDVELASRRCSRQSGVLIKRKVVYYYEEGSDSLWAKEGSSRGALQFCQYGDKRDNKDIHLLTPLPSWLTPLLFLFSQFLLLLFTSPALVFLPSPTMSLDISSTPRPRFWLSLPIKLRSRSLWTGPMRTTLRSSHEKTGALCVMTLSKFHTNLGVSFKSTRMPTSMVCISLVSLPGSHRVDNSGTRVNELSGPLATAGISIFYQSSYMCDFIFVCFLRFPVALVYHVPRLKNLAYMRLSLCSKQLVLISTHPTWHLCHPTSPCHLIHRPHRPSSPSIQVWISLILLQPLPIYPTAEHPFNIWMNFQNPTHLQSLK